MTEKEMKLLHERMKKEDPRLLALMEKCFDAGVMSGKEQAQRTWVGLPKSAFTGMTLQQVSAMQYAEQVLKDENT